MDKVLKAIDEDPNIPYTVEHGWTSQSELPFLTHRDIIATNYDHNPDPRTDFSVADAWGEQIPFKIEE